MPAPCTGCVLSGLHTRALGQAGPVKLYRVPAQTIILEKGSRKHAGRSRNAEEAHSTAIFASNWREHGRLVIWEKSRTSVISAHNNPLTRPESPSWPLNSMRSPSPAPCRCSFSRSSKGATPFCAAQGAARLPFGAARGAFGRTLERCSPGGETGGTGAVKEKGGSSAHAVLRKSSLPIFISGRARPVRRRQRNRRTAAFDRADPQCEATRLPAACFRLRENAPHCPALPLPTACRVNELIFCRGDTVVWYRAQEQLGTCEQVSIQKRATGRPLAACPNCNVKSRERK